MDSNTKYKEMSFMATAKKHKTKRAKRTTWRKSMMRNLNNDITNPIPVRFDIFNVIHGKDNKITSKYTAKQLLSVFPYLIAVGAAYYSCKYSEIVDFGSNVDKRIRRSLKMSDSRHVKYNEMFRRGGFVDTQKLTKPIKYQDLPIQKDPKRYLETNIKNHLFIPLSAHKDVLRQFFNLNKGSAIMREPLFATGLRYYHGKHYRGTFYDSYKSIQVSMDKIYYMIHDLKLYPWEVGLYYYILFKSINAQTDGVYNISYQDVMDYWGATQSTTITMFKHLKEAGVIEVVKVGRKGRKQTLRINEVQVKTYE